MASFISTIPNCFSFEIGAPTTSPTCSYSIVSSSPMNLPTLPFHPPSNFVFKARLQGKQKRYCQAKWFLQFKWLHYNQDNDTVPCFTCMKQNAFGKLTTARNKENAIVLTGYSNWKDALQHFREHEASECHSLSTTFENVVPKCGNVCEMTDASVKASMQENRRCFIKIIESLQFLGRQGIAMQGHIDTQSNFVQLLQLRCKDFTPLKAWLSKKN